MKNRSSLNTRMREFVPLVASRIRAPVIRPYRKYSTIKKEKTETSAHWRKATNTWSARAESPPWQAQWRTRSPIGSLRAGARLQCSCRAAQWRCWSKRSRSGPRPRKCRVWEQLPNPAPCRHLSRSTAPSNPCQQKHQLGGQRLAMPGWILCSSSVIICQMLIRARKELNYCLKQCTLAKSEGTSQTLWA